MRVHTMQSNNGPSGGRKVPRWKTAWQPRVSASRSPLACLGGCLGLLQPVWPSACVPACLYACVEPRQAPQRSVPRSTTDRDSLQHVEAMRPCRALPQSFKRVFHPRSLCRDPSPSHARRRRATNAANDNTHRHARRPWVRPSWAAVSVRVSSSVPASLCVPRWGENKARNEALGRPQPTVAAAAQQSLSQSARRTRHNSTRVRGHWSAALWLCVCLCPCPTDPCSSRPPPAVPSVLL